MSNFKRESISSVQVQHYYHHLSPQTAAPDLNAQIWFAGLPAAALLIAPQGTIIAANALAAQLLAQSQSELIHQSLASLFPAVAGDQSSPVSRLECRSPGQVTGLKGTGEVVKLQFRVITDRNDQAHLLLLSEADTTHFARVSALIDAYLKALQGDTEAVRPINGASAALETESTDRDRQSHAVGANRFILAPLPGHAEPCLLRLTPEGQLTDVNDACCHLWGQPASALVGRHVSELWPEQQELISRQWAQINQCTPRDPVLVQAHPTVTATGQTIQHQWIYQALFDDRNQLQAVQAVGIELGGHPRDTPLIADYDQQLALFFAQAIEGCFFMMLDEPVRWDDSVDKEAVLDYAFAHQRITRVNQALLQQYGCTESEAIGQTPNDFFAHDLATCRLVLRQLFDEGHLHINTHERKADGTPMWIEGDYICLYDAQGRITGNFGVQRDVTHIREAIAAVAQSEQQYRLLVENQTDFIVKTDVDGNFLFVSPSYCHLCGLSTEELLTQTLLHGLHPEDQAATQWALAALHFPPHTCKLEQRLQTPRGWRWLAWTYTAVLDEAENIIAVVGAGRDVTERKAMESQLQQSERQFRNVLETLTLVAIMLDRQGKILFCNDYLLSLTGWNCDEVLGQSWAEQFLPADIRPVLQQWLQQTFEQQIFPSYYENEIVTREGDRRLIAWNNTVQRDSAGQVLSLTSIGEDITERKRTQDQIYELSQRLSLATQSSQSGVWDLDIATNQVVWDERMYGIYGLSPAKPKMTYRRWQARVHPDDIAVVRRSEHQIEQGSNNLYCEFRIVCPNGNIRHIEAHTCVLRDKQGNPRRLIGMNRDISDRKAAESALAMAHQQLQALMQNSPAIVALFDENGSYQRVNTITSQLFNQPAAAIAGRTFSEIHPPEMSALLTARLQQLTTTQQPLVVEDRLTTRDGDRFLQSVLFPVMSRPDQPDLFGWIATDITELVQAKEHLQRQAERERLLREITTNIRQSLHLKTILNSTADSVRDFLDTDRVLIYRFNSDWSGRILVESVGPQWIKTLDLDLMDPCLSTTWVEPYLQGRVSQIADIDSDEIVPCHRAFLKQFQVRANLVLPLVVDDQLWGLLCIHHCRSPRQWSPEDVVFVQQVCDQVDIAIQQAKLLQSEKSRARRESLHRRITQDIRRSLDIETILQTTADEIRAFLKTDRVLINRIDAESGDRQILSQSLATDIAPIEAQDAACPCLDQGRAELLLQYPYLQINHTQLDADSTGDRDLFDRYRTRSMLTLPLMVEQALWGTLCIHQCDVVRQWQTHEISFVQQLTDQVEIALQQAQLLFQTTVRAQREQVLNEIVSSIRDSLDLQAILDRTNQKLVAAFDVNRCIIAFCDGQAEYLEYFSTAAQVGTDALVGQRIPLQNNPHAQAVLAQVAPLAIDDIMTGPLMTPALQKMGQRLNIRALLTVSIRDGDQIKGLLCVQSNVPRKWTSDECQLIKQVADQLAIAIQQAELYQQAQAELARRQQLETQLRQAALHDSLTGLPNRALFLERLQLALQRFQRRLHPHLTAASAPIEFAVLFLDLDRFKVINDSLGHSFGDQLLQLVSVRLTQCLRGVDIAARLGGDEFVVLLEELTEPQFAIEVARRIHNVLEDTPIMIDGREIFIRVSIGITLVTHYHATPEQILRDADIAMYKAKKSNREYVVFDASMHEMALQQLNIEHDLRHAIKRNELRLFYQPIVDLKTGQITGFEALVRWQHPTRGLLYPNAFVEVAEDTGLISAIDLWVLQMACHQLSKWRQLNAQFADLTMSVNLSGKQFSQPNLIAQIDQALAQANLPGDRLKLEITESVLITNNTLAVQILHKFRDRDIQVCMDDFGTGYSSLSYLHQFPVDILKIDKSFILNLGSPQVSDRDYEIVRAIVNLALNLHLTVIAEGIENEEVMAHLRANNCQLGQGHYFSQAVDADTATQLLLQAPFTVTG